MIKRLYAYVGFLFRCYSNPYSSAPLRMSFGIATSESGETVEGVIRRADAQMYERKREYYAAHGAAEVRRKRNIHIL